MRTLRKQRMTLDEAVFLVRETLRAVSHPDYIVLNALNDRALGNDLRAGR